MPHGVEIVRLLKHALTAVPAERLWVNADCGLKKRRLEEVVPALRNMVAAASHVRNGLVGPERDEGIEALRQP